MSCVKSLWFLLVIVLISVVQSKEICDFVNVKCMTNGARNVLKTLVAGIEDVIEPIDPMFVGDIKGEVPDTKYSLSNPKMTGLKNCLVTELAFQPDRITFEYELFCPQLVLQYGCEAKGTLGPLKMDGNGQVKVTLNDYAIILRGHIENFTSEEDNKLRSRVIDFNLETQPTGNIVFEINDLFHRDEEQSLAWINENSLDLEKYLRPVIQEFMKVFIDKINVICSTFPLDEIIPKV